MSTEDRRMSLLGIPALVVLLVGGAERAAGSETWFPFQPVRDELEATILDLSSLVEAPAGQRGFVRAAKDGFVFEDGTPARFWGVNLGVFEKGEVVYAVRRLRKLGVNAVRLETPVPGEPAEADMWERLDFLISQLGEHGIYVVLSLGGMEGDAGSQLIALFDDAARAASLQRLRDAATRRNVYTGRRLCDDPTIALVEMARRATLLGEDADRVPAAHRAALEARFAAWLRERYHGDAELARAWSVAGHRPLSPGEGLKAGRMGVIPMRQILGGDPDAYPELRRRTRDQLRFFHDLEQAYWEGARARLRDAGVRVPIAGPPVAGPRPGTTIHLGALAGLDHVAARGLWDEPREGAGEGAGLRGSTFHNQPMVRSVGSLGAASEDQNLILAKAWEQVLGKPLTISAWSTCAPNQYSLEGVGLMAAYGSLQGWDGVFELGILTPLWVTRMGHEPFNMMANPPQFLQIPAAAALWHRADVQEASVVAEAVHADDDLYEAGAKQHDVAIEAALVGKVGARFPAAARPGVRREVDRYLDPSAGVARSLTGELEWDARGGVVTVDTARTQAWIGFVGGGIRRLSAAALETSTRFAAVYVTAMDGMEGVPDARRVLVTAVGRARNTGMAYRQAVGAGAPSETQWQLESEGGPPIEIEVVVGEVRVRTRHWQSLRAWALDNTGRRREELAVDRDNGFVTLRLAPRAAVVYYELGLD